MELLILCKNEVVPAFLIYRHAKFSLPNSSNSLNVSNKEKTTYRFHAAPMLLFYIL
jgi:hypothetical protein